MESMMPTSGPDAKPALEVDPEVLKLQAQCAHYLGTEIAPGQVADACLGTTNVGEQVVWSGVVDQQFDPGSAVFLDQMTYAVNGTAITTNTVRLGEGTVDDNLTVVMEGQEAVDGAQSTLTLQIGKSGFCALAGVTKESLKLLSCDPVEADGIELPDTNIN